MGTNDPFAENFLAELKRRAGRILIIAWRGANLENPIFRTEDDIFLRRTRTAKRWDKLTEAA